MFCGTFLPSVPTLCESRCTALSDFIRDHSLYWDPIPAAYISPGPSPVILPSTIEDHNDLID